MKYIILIFCFLPICSPVAAQQDVWTGYWNADTTLYGFKDSNGKVVIPPRFSSAGIAGKWEHIMSVIEQHPQTGKWTFYFLTRNGKRMGFDSLYFFDNLPDCENEGFIRFRDKERDKAGLLNRNGEVVVPAVYNYLDRVQNGLLTGLTGARKKQDGEHFYWEGGETVLLDTTGSILIQPFSTTSNLSLYDIKKSDRLTRDPDRISFKGVDGYYYSFVNYQQEFANWLKNLLLKLDLDRLKAHAFDKVAYYTEDKEWVFKEGKLFVDENYSVLEKTLNMLRQSSCDSFITSDGLNPFLYESEEYQKYFDNCNQAKEWKYPQMSIYINDSNGKQERLDFLRTDEGYQLISVNIKGVTTK